MNIPDPNPVSCFVPQSHSSSDLGAAAARDLHAIRTLMERANVYEAISAPTALFAGSLATAAGCALAPVPSSPAFFVGIWGLAFVAVNIFNVVALKRRARRRGEPFVSGGMKLTLRAVAPPLAAGALVGAALAALPAPLLSATAAIWITCYGLALCATAPFAPAALPRLGLAFVLTGVPLILASPTVPAEDASKVAWLSMAATFGIYHLAYATILSCARHRSPSPLPDQPPSPTQATHV
ncbi:hypothetical protein BH23VER1_BH23VER1_06200 [soil metagenome]